MQSEKKTTLRILLTAFALQLFAFNFLFAQDNSPYSRYGLGDLTPGTNIVNRGMGGVSAAYSDPFAFTINFSNPASYSGFFAPKQANSKKSAYGRMLLDVGINYDNHTLKQTNPPAKFTSSNILFSYVQLGIPLKSNWGLNLGLRPLSKINYKVNRFERLYDPVTGNIDSALTQFTGDGGSFLATIGIGFSVMNKQLGTAEENRYSKLSMGFNFGYIFGKKDFVTKRAFANDTVSYKPAEYTNNTGFGHVFLSGGLQYKVDLKNKKTLYLGAFGNLKTTMNASQDLKVETFFVDPNGGPNIRLDSVYENKGIKGKVIYPASYTAGFVLEKQYDPKKNNATWLFGADVVQNKWSQYRFYGTGDSVQNNWEVRVGAQMRPAAKNNYRSLISYRAGFFIGKDYIHVKNQLPEFGVSFGMGLPLVGINAQARNQASIINLSMEYIRRGNNNNILKENLFRISVGFSFSDLWFIKRKYD